ncbi:toll-like receptor 8 [Pseudophryne corroboree]|uniref:toll-like receptor 8 n=1 Tax=Pseudophryne corroboree TaxID=495146 RepID=UPI003081CABE
MLSSLKCLFSKLLIISGCFAFYNATSTNKTFPCSIQEYNNSIVFDCTARSLRIVPYPITYVSSNVELLLNQNLIQSIYNPSFQHWQNLTKIDLSMNHYPKSKLDNPIICKRGLEINNETFSNLTKLEQLIIDHNFLCEIPSGLPDTVTLLSFQYNNILSITKKSVSRFKNLCELYLGNNCYYGNNCNGTFDIENGTFSNLTELTVLDLSFNNLTKVPPELPPSLRKLYLSSNKIQIIYRDDFKYLVNLEILFLSGNCPRCYNAPYPCEPCTGKSSSIEIDDYAFQNLKNLTMLHLGSTSLSFIPKTWFQNTTQLKVLNLQLNYLVDAIATGEFLSYLPFLEKLDLSFNYKFRSYPNNINISDNFSKLVSLRELHIQGYVFKEITSENVAPLTKLNKLKILNFGVNFIRQVDFKVFQKFASLDIIDLSENRITPFSETTNRSKTLEAFYNKQSKSIESHFSSNILDNAKVSPKNIVSFNKLVKPECSAYGKSLGLNSNSIFFIDPEEFRPFSDVACLNLSSNGIGQDLNGTEFIYLPNLAYLDLSFNKLDFASLYAFQELKNLTVLDVSFNKHYFIVEGVTHHLKFIENLHKLSILNLSYNDISTLTEYQINSNSLTELRFAGNHLDILWRYGDRRYIDLFKNITNLTLLDISHNRLQTIPDDAISNLSKCLSELYLSNNGLEFFGWNNLKHLKNLKVLDLSHNKITMIGHLSNYTESLETLIISHNMIQTLTEGFLTSVSSLTNLDLSYNNIQSINKSIFLSGNENYLDVLSLKGNPFECTCDIIDFIQWINNNNVTIPRLATDVTCATPDNWKKRGIIDFDIHACNLDMIALLLFLMFLFLIIPMTALPIMKHLFYWDVWYIYHWFMAKLKYNKVCHSESLYDAFITYDETDPAVTDWVYNELCYQVEVKGEKRILLCLEERDWEPGKAVIDNIVQSINQSKKTLFILTKKYVKSGKFRTIFYLAMQKLMDENMDVIVIVLLQPVLQHSQYLRLRKKICKSSILEWPKNPHGEYLFWQRMKHVLLTENVSRYNKMYTDSIAMHK